MNIYIYIQTYIPIHIHEYGFFFCFSLFLSGHPREPRHREGDDIYFMYIRIYKINTYTYIYIYAYICIYIYISIYTHTYMRTHLPMFIHKLARIIFFFFSHIIQLTPIFCLLLGDPREPRHREGDDHDRPQHHRHAVARRHGQPQEEGVHN